MIGLAQNAVNQFLGLFTPAGSVTQLDLQVLPNHAMERTAPQLLFTFQMNKSFTLRATRALASGR